MFGKTKNPKSINFLNPVYTPTDIWSRAYIWLADIGKYLLIAVELVVLGVFFSRFSLDRQNNDLTEKINNSVALVSNDSWNDKNFLFANYQDLLSDVKTIRLGQDLNSSVINELLNGVPQLLTLNSFSFREGVVSFSLTSTNSSAIEDYESTLKNNSDYTNVSFNIVKEGATYNVRVSFSLVEDNV